MSLTAIVAIASLTAIVAAASLTPCISSLLALGSSRLSRSWIQLPNGKEVSLGISQLGEPPHPRHRALAPEDLGPEALRLADKIVPAFDADVIDRGLVGVHATHEPAVDARFAWPSPGIGRNRLHHPIFEVLVPVLHPFTRALKAVDVPAEQLPIELCRPLRIVRWNLEM